MCRLSIIGLVLETHLLRTDKVYSFYAPLKEPPLQLQCGPLPDFHLHCMITVSPHSYRATDKDKSKIKASQKQIDKLMDLRGTILCPDFFKMTSHAAAHKSHS